MTNHFHGSTLTTLVMAPALLPLIEANIDTLRTPLLNAQLDAYNLEHNEDALVEAGEYTFKIVILSKYRIEMQLIAHGGRIKPQGILIDGDLPTSVFSDLIGQTMGDIAGIGSDATIKSAWSNGDFTFAETNKRALKVKLTKLV